MWGIDTGKIQWQVNDAVLNDCHKIANPHKSLLQDGLCSKGNWNKCLPKKWNFCCKYINFRSTIYRGVCVVFCLGLLRSPLPAFRIYSSPLAPPHSQASSIVLLAVQCFICMCSYLLYIGRARSALVSLLHDFSLQSIPLDLANTTAISPRASSFLRVPLHFIMQKMALSRWTNSRPTKERLYQRYKN